MDRSLGECGLRCVQVDRLTRSLSDFAKIVEAFEAHDVTFVSVTQAFNTTTSMGRLTLNMLLSFAQFEREASGERIQDKIAASKRKGMWMGGRPPFRSCRAAEAGANLMGAIFSAATMPDGTVNNTDC